VDKDDDLPIDIDPNIPLNASTSRSQECDGANMVIQYVINSTHNCSQWVMIDETILVLFRLHFGKSNLISNFCTSYLDLAFHGMNYTSIDRENYVGSRPEMRGQILTLQL